LLSLCNQNQNSFILRAECDATMLAQLNIAAKLVVSTKALQSSTIGAQIQRHLVTKKKGSSEIN
jgi:hypothetical protein